MEKRSGGWELVGGLAVGAIGGFMVGLLVAPRPRTGAGNLDDRLADAQGALEQLRDSTESILKSTRSAIEEKMALLQEAVEAGRKAAAYKRAELIDQDLD